jgi:hypothetical protein
LTPPRAIQITPSPFRTFLLLAVPAPASFELPSKTSRQSLLSIPVPTSFMPPMNKNQLLHIFGGAEGLTGKCCVPIILEVELN